TAISSDSGTAGDFITSDTTLTVSGRSYVLAPGVKIRVGSYRGATWTDVVQGAPTAWSLVDLTAHATSFTYQARIVDAAANVGTRSEERRAGDESASREAPATTANNNNKLTAVDVLTRETMHHID